LSNDAEIAPAIVNYFPPRAYEGYPAADCRNWFQL